MQPYERRQMWWRMLGWSFLLGAVVDIGFGLGMLLAAHELAPLLGVPLPAPKDRLYFDLAGLLLVGLGLAYVAVWREPQRLAPLAAVATLLRFAGFALFLRHALLPGAPPFWLAAGTIDALLAFTQLVLLRLAAGSMIGAFYRRE